MRLTEEEGDEYLALTRRIGAWVTYCEACRKAKPRVAIDRSLDLPDADYLRWNELYWRL